MTKSDKARVGHDIISQKNLVLQFAMLCCPYFECLTIYFPFQVSHHPPMGAGHAENEHFTYDVTSKLKTKFLGNSVDVYPVGR